MHRALVGLLAISVATLAQTAEVVKNSDFSTRPPNGGGVPSSWSVPSDSPWHSANDDGHSGADSLRYRSRAALAGKPVTQTVTLDPDTTYVLTAAFKQANSVVIFVKLPREGAYKSKQSLERVINDFDG